MKLSAEREALLAPLQAVIGVVERRQTMPILANVLLVASDDRLDITATDLEVELVASGDLTVQEPGEITVPGRKLLDICRALPEGATVNVTQNGDRIILRSGRSRFTLSTLPASEFPVIEQINSQLDLEVEQKSLRRLLEKTHFSMAQQDVRYYLNGMLVEAEGQHLRTVATDGHRLAMSEIQLSDELGASQQVIVPRKGVLELQRLLGEQGSAAVSVGTNHIRVSLDGIRFTSKLIDGRFPEYS
ncbi:MAG: DNA polymerase III subunit beta, partial [Chromatiales bacterium]|nr:DNA polymerase III subunit beta [Chromatiales bacterium]